jgi:hypothetical protein
MDVLASRILLHPLDPDATRRFYAETLGLAVFREWGEGAHRGTVFFLGNGLLEVSGGASRRPRDRARRGPARAPAAPGGLTRRRSRLRPVQAAGPARVGRIWEGLAR